MAELVIGIATSHAPQLSTPLALWSLHAERDQRDQVLHFRGGRYSYPELLELRAQEDLGRFVGPEQWAAAFERCEAAIRSLGAVLQAARPEIIVMIGDDQREWFWADNLPALSIYSGPAMTSWPPDPITMHPALRPARWAMYGEQPTLHPGAPEVGEYLAAALTEAGFDVACSTQPPGGRTLGHAFNFLYQRLWPGCAVPMVPVCVNTYYSPNQPTPRRLYAFGQALVEAIGAWPVFRRVAVIASGGLSHFVVDEALDRTLLEGLRLKDRATVQGLPNEWLTSGTGELRNWVVAAGAMEQLPLGSLEYIPVYRTPAGTGCGMAFAHWQGQTHP